MGRDAGSCVSDTSSRLDRSETALDHGIACRRALWTMLLTTEGRDFKPVLIKKENILNTCYCIVHELELGLVVQINWMLFYTVCNCNV